MARPLRYEAAGAVYYPFRQGYAGTGAMASGDGGKPVLEDDKNHYDWVDLLENACERFGWRVKVRVLTGNHCHLFIETSEAVLALGNCWLAGKILKTDRNNKETCLRVTARSGFETLEIPGGPGQSRILTK